MAEQGDDSGLLDLRARIRDDFVKQLKEDKFVLYFQSIVPAPQASTEPRFREILVRYKEEEQDLRAPSCRSSRKTASCRCWTAGWSAA